jgi:hypothetical protein
VAVIYARWRFSRRPRCGAKDAERAGDASSCTGKNIRPQQNGG